ncbi:MAG: diadenylate cyclase CdaA [Candidatus Omnitrophota bacterium]
MAWKAVIEIAILWLVIYQILIFLQRSRAIYAFRGIALIAIAFILFHKLDLRVLQWLLEKLFTISIISLLIIFHPEIRQGLAKLGQRQLFNPPLKEEELDVVLQQIARAVESLSREKIGALIAIEKNDSLATYIENGVAVNALVTPDLIQTIFTPNSMLHDGGIIIKDGRIASAGSIFPLTQKQDLSRIFGTRHRAALGLSEETDAIIIAVSEERQNISVVFQSKLYKDLSKDEMLLKIRELIKQKK